MLSNYIYQRINAVQGHSYCLIMLTCRVFVTKRDTSKQCRVQLFVNTY
jgi:hypothetical protein